MISRDQKVTHFNSIKEAAEKTGLNSLSIWRCCHTKGRTAGVTFRYLEDYGQ